MTDDPVREPEMSETETPSGWTAPPPGQAATQAWMGGPPPPAKAVRTTGNVVLTVVLLVVGIGLLIYGVPAVYLHIRASLGEGWPPEGNFLRAAVAFVGFFFTLLGIGSLLAMIRSRRG